MTTSILNEDQQKAHDVLVPYIMGEDKTYAAWVLEGYAGTGKSFTLGQIVGTVQKLSGNDVFGGPRIVMSAPTHKAVRVMKKFAKGFPGVAFSTVHSLLGLKEQLDTSGPIAKIKFVQDKDPNKIKIEGFDVLFLDEVSQLIDELFKLLMPYIKKGLKIIFVGDPVQIPPINHLDAIPLLENKRAEYNIGIVRLEKIVRQAMDNPILTYATMIRKAYKTASNFPVGTHIHESKGIVAVKEEDDEMIQSVIEQHFNCESFRQDADHMKVVSWTNKTADSFNNQIRAHIYRGHPGILPYLMAGEKMIINAPVVLPNGRILLSNNEEIVIDNYEIKETSISYLTMNVIDRQWVPDNPEVGLKYYNTYVRYFDEDGTEQIANIRILHESENSRMQNILGTIKKAAMGVGSDFRNKLWASYFKVDRIFADTKYNYALTAHKAQGSTYENCMMVDWDIAHNPKTEERNRIRYVAATRSRNLLFIVK